MYIEYSSQDDQIGELLIQSSVYFEPFTCRAAYRIWGWGREQIEFPKILGGGRGGERNMGV